GGGSALLFWRAGCVSDRSSAVLRSLTLPARQNREVTTIGDYRSGEESHDLDLSRDSRQLLALWPAHRPEPDQPQAALLPAAYVGADGRRARLRRGAREGRQGQGGREGRLFP